MDQPHRIMLVEDSPTQAIKLRYVLEKEGWEVVWAATAQQAMEEINRPRPDLILLDYYLPGIRGDELCRRIRMNIDTRGIPILMMTVEETDEAEIHGLESGADDFVAKSVDADILLLRIRTLLNKAAAPGVDPRPGRLALPPRPAADHRRQPHLPRVPGATSWARKAIRSSGPTSGQEGWNASAASRSTACWSTW